MTMFLLARGADPQAPGMSAEAEAELLGHWLAAEVIRAWTKCLVLGELAGAGSSFQWTCRTG